MQEFHFFGRETRLFNQFAKRGFFRQFSRHITHTRRDFNNHCIESRTKLLEQDHLWHTLIVIADGDDRNGSRRAHNVTGERFSIRSHKLTDNHIPDIPRMNKLVSQMLERSHDPLRRSVPLNAVRRYRLPQSDDERDIPKRHQSSHEIAGAAGLDDS